MKTSIIVLFIAAAGLAASTCLCACSKASREEEKQGARNERVDVTSLSASESTEGGTAALPSVVPTQALLRFSDTVRIIDQVSQGGSPLTNDIVRVVDALPTLQLIEVIHASLYRGSGSYETALAMCTNAIAKADSEDARNRLIHFAGVAYEKMANAATDASAKRASSEKALEYYQSVLDRAERHISTAEAANSAFFAACVMKNMERYQEAERYFNLFADLSEHIDNNHDNAVFAKYRLAAMLAFTEPDRAEQLCKYMIEREPSSRHRQSFEKVLDTYVPQGRRQRAR